MITRRIAAAIDNFAEFEPLGDLAVKGLRRPVAVLNVLGLALTSKTGSI